MKFIIELVASTGNIDKYNIAGYLSPSDNEKDLMEEMIECLNEVMDNMGNLSNYIRVKEDKIIYNNIPIVPCSSIIKILQDSLSIKIDVVISDNAKFIPKDCNALFKMELNRLFN